MRAGHTSTISHGDFHLEFYCTGKTWREFVVVVADLWKQN